MISFFFFRNSAVLQIDPENCLERPAIFRIGL